MSHDMKERYITMKHQLEYFYLIRTDKIIDAITKEISDKATNPTSLLDIIFKHTFNGISPYNDFINLDSYHPFFHENVWDSNIRGLCQLLYITLQNNCILNVFFQDIIMNSGNIEISGKNEPTIKRSIINMIYPKHEEKKLTGETRSQFFNNRKNIFNNKYENTYTKSILKSLNISENVLPITVLQYCAPAANFLFTEDICNKFSSCLHKEKNIIDKYNILWNKCQEQQNNYQSNIDKLIFESEMNAIFGFPYFASICNFIDEVHKTSTSKEKTLKDLEGQAFTNIMMQTANLPLFFNKELFIKFACYAFLSSPEIDYSYFEQSAKSAMTIISSSKAKQQQVIDGLDLMRKFFLIISSVTLPVLFCAWDIVVYELNKKKQFLSINSDIFEQYFSENYNSIVYNYFSIPDDKICEWGALKFTVDKHVDNELLKKYIEKNPIHYNEMNKIRHIFPLETSNYSLELVQQMLQSYCNLQSLEELRFPLLFLTHNELSDYSPLSTLIAPLCAQPYPAEHEYIAENSFLINSKNALFDYLFSNN